MQPKKIEKFDIEKRLENWEMEKATRASRDDADSPAENLTSDGTIAAIGFADGAVVTDASHCDTLLLSDAGSHIKLAAEILREGGLVAFPTETVYGLGADALNPEAVGRVYQAKGRPSDNPMIVHIAFLEDMKNLTPETTDDMAKLAKAYWPGPLTMVVPRREAVPNVVTGGLDTVGVRMPSNSVARVLIAEAGCPVAAPSANISGRPSPTSASHVVEDLDGRVDAIIISDDCEFGLESTVVDMTCDPPMILRPGVITKEMLELALDKPVDLDPTLNIVSKQIDLSHGLEVPEGGKPFVAEAGKDVFVTDEKETTVATEEDALSDFKPKSPGMKYKHYAPKAEMIIFTGDETRARALMK